MVMARYTLTIKYFECKGNHDKTNPKLHLLILSKEVGKKNTYCYKSQQNDAEHD